MASVLIKGMKMPQSCLLCPFGDEFGKCCVNAELEDANELTHSCPLIELPDHGDLIDRDVLVALWEEDIVDNKESGITDYAYTDIERIYREFIYDAKMFRVVIPAERSEDATD